MKATRAFSSDGRFLAYMSDESGRYEIYVQPYPGPGAKTQVSTEGGQFPIWNPADRELFYQVEAERDGDVRLMAVQYGIDGDTFLPEKPSELFRGPFAMGPRAEYDVSPDGERFVMLPARKHEPHASHFRSELVRRAKAIGSDSIRPMGRLGAQGSLVTERGNAQSEGGRE